MTNKIIAVVLAIVVGVAMVPVVMNSIESLDTDATTETFTAEEDATVEETFTVENVIESLTSVTVEGAELEETEYSYTGSDVTLDDDASDTGEEVKITYDYEREVPATVDSMVNLLPIMFVIILVVGAVGYIRT